MTFGTNPFDNTTSLFYTPSCVTSPLGAHKFNLTFAEEISTLFRCCEVCGKTSRLRCTVSNTWEDINEPAQKDAKG